MKYFAKIDENNVVLQVIVAENLTWCEQVLGGTWIETSQDGTITKNYAVIGSTWDADLNGFHVDFMYPSWIFDPQTFRHEPPVPFPTDGKNYLWDESVVNWVEVQGE